MITQPAPRTNIALIVSLCVNLLLAGVIATAAYRHFTQPPEAPMFADTVRTDTRHTNATVPGSAMSSAFGVYSACTENVGQAHPHLRLTTLCRCRSGRI